MLNLEDLTVGQTVTAHEAVWLFAGIVDGRAVLVSDLRADLSAGFTGYPKVNGLLTSVATARTYQATVVSAKWLS